MKPELERFLTERGIGTCQKELLDRYKDLFLRVSKRINLISAGDRNRLEERHFADSLAPVDLVPAEAKVADWGSGGGLPGIPLAIARPDVSVTLVESRQKKASFLLRVIRELQIPNLSLFPDRGENLREYFGFITIRAIGRINEIIPTVVKHLEKEGALLFYKGPGLDAELCQAHRMIVEYEFKEKVRSEILPCGEERRYLLLYR